MRRVATAALLGVSLVLGLPVRGAAQNPMPPGYNGQGSQWTSGDACPPVTAPSGRPGSIYTCATTDGLYTWDGSAWTVVGASGTLGPTAIQSMLVAPDSALYSATLAGMAGNVPNGTHRYKITYANQATPGGLETDTTGATVAVTVVDHTLDGQVTVTIPAVCTFPAPYVNVYRDADGDGVFRFVGSNGWNCGTTFTDNVADADLGALAPTTNSTTFTVLEVVDGYLDYGYLTDDGGAKAWWLGAPDATQFKLKRLGNPTGSGGNLLVEAGEGTTSGGTVLLRGGVNAENSSAGTLFLPGGEGACCTTTTLAGNHGTGGSGLGGVTIGLADNSALMGVTTAGEAFITASGFNINGKAGVTKTTGCTITEITNGLITETSGC